MRMPGSESCPFMIAYFAGQFVKAANRFACQPMIVSCFRCGCEEELASLKSPAKAVKVCSASHVKGL